MSSNLRLRLFGAPAVTGADGAPVGGGALEPHRLGLLALLALHPKRAVARAELASRLWPTRTEEQARQALNQAIFAITKALGDDSIFASAKEVRLGAQVSVDALDFQSALEGAKAEEAKRLYTAPLLDGFELEDAPEFNDWAATERSRFAKAARTGKPVAEAETEVVHELADPEPPKPKPKATRSEKPRAAPLEQPKAAPPEQPASPPEQPKKEGRKEPGLPSNFVLLEPEVESRVAHAPEGPALQAQVPHEPDLLTNDVPSEPEAPASAPPPQREELVFVPTHQDAPPPSPPPPPAPPPPPPTPVAEVKWIEPDPPQAPPPAAPAAPAYVAPTPAAAESPREAAPAIEPAPVESMPPERRAKRKRRPLPLPSRRLVVTLVVLLVLGAAGYMARGWIGVARGSVEAARDQVEAARVARERARSITVMPIEYGGRNQADAALAARIAGELGPMLTRAGLIVAPSAALVRGGAPYDLRAIADSLKVDHVLQGVMQPEGDRVAFRFRLVNPADGTARWEDSYRPLRADVPVLQEEVAATVAARILKKDRE